MAGTYEELQPAAEWRDASGIKFLCVTLEKLIYLKRAAGRPRTFEMLARLEAARQEIRSDVDRPPSEASAIQAGKRDNCGKTKSPSRICSPGLKFFTPPVPFRRISRSLSVTGG